MRRIIYFIIGIIVFLNMPIQCNEISNHGIPQTLCEYFPLLNSHIPKSNITIIANSEGNQPWWHKIRRTPAYGACLEMENLLQSVYEAGENLRTLRAQEKENADRIAAQKEPYLADFTEENLQSFVQEKIATILGETSDSGTHKKEYDRFITTIAALKKNFEQSSDQYHAEASKKLRRKISITDSTRPQWTYMQ